MQTMDSPLQIFFYVLTLKDVNMYEQQLIVANLAKMNVYSGLDARKMNDMMLQETKKL